MSGKRNVSVCIGHELANALYIYIYIYIHIYIYIFVAGANIFDDETNTVFCATSKKQYFDKIGKDIKNSNLLINLVTVTCRLNSYFFNLFNM